MGAQEVLRCSSMIRQVYPSSDQRVSYPEITPVNPMYRREAKKTPILTYSVNGPFASLNKKIVKIF